MQTLSCSDSVSLMYGWAILQYYRHYAILGYMQYQYRKDFHISILLHMQYIA